MKWSYYLSVHYIITNAATKLIDFHGNVLNYENRITSNFLLFFFNYQKYFDEGSDFKLFIFLNITANHEQKNPFQGWKMIKEGKRI